MKAFYSPRQTGHMPSRSFYRGRFTPAHENPERVACLLRALERASCIASEPTDAGLAPILAIHDADYVEFVRDAWLRWRTDDASGDVIPNVFPPSRASVRERAALPVLAQAGIFMGDLSCPIGKGTFEGAYWSAQTAVAAADAVLAGETLALALCRPPGHHAQRDRASGYCFFNNAAIAAARLRERVERVAIIDFDMHHGDGTQSIFYARGDVLTASAHADPRDTFPFFSGAADECGEGAGLGANLNIPLPAGADDDTFVAAVAALFERARTFGAQALVIAAGWDAHGDDPLSPFDVTSAAYARIARLVKAQALPTVIVQEGGYHPGAIEDALLAFLDALA
ncbi:Acetylpolyamine amidohydrolase [Paraburkholderia tropica]|uniref:histone deacetylase family protein n=1 Tax=Paraburkholderia tropica TaxID=92647 RepID=UPI001CAEECA8|nr:histone deacetylase family protein [Paraburkholderia tropica]CAG9216586.1 Acetylpolyamine amidohydrolase [Paraburkholderia tropica]